MPLSRLNLTNPVNWRHPLNVGRRGWWLAPNASGHWGGDRWYDLCRGFHGAFENGGVAPDWRVGTPSGPPSLLFGGTGGGLGWNANLGGATAFSYTDNFTVGIQFRPATLDPIDINGLAGLIGKNHANGDQSWLLRQYTVSLGVGGVEFGGVSGVQSGNILSTSVTSRVVVTMANGTCTIYHQGLSVASGSITVATANQPVRIGVDYFDTAPRYFIGWIEEAFIVNRAWTPAEVKLDRLLSLRQYEDPRGPLNFIDSRITRTTDSGQTVSFTTGINVGGPLLFATPANFTTTLGAFASAGGIGPEDSEGTPEFVTQVGILTPFQAGEPTLVNHVTRVTVDDTLQAGAPAMFTTTVKCGQSLRTIPNGDRRILAQRRYRR